MDKVFLGNTDNLYHLNSLFRIIWSLSSRKMNTISVIKFMIYNRLGIHC